MALKDTYKEIEKEKENEVDDKEYSMPLNDFIEEHKKLIKILRKGDKNELMAEADSQEKELNECLKEHNDD